MAPPKVAKEYHNNDNTIMDGGVQTLLKKLEIQKQRPPANQTDIASKDEFLCSNASTAHEFKKKLSIFDNSANVIGEIEDSSSLRSTDADATSLRSYDTGVDTVDVIVSNTLRKLAKKKSDSALGCPDTNEYEADVRRSKTSIQEFRQRFSSSSSDKQGKEGWNSLETTPTAAKPDKQTRLHAVVKSGPPLLHTTKDVVIENLNKKPNSYSSKAINDKHGMGQNRDITE